ncbi:MAG: hypothetical protein ONA69_09350, partial [candidate division KSB1 bacterium]|nr:hypothetical protein [candidate division KSB1 bacterium]
LGSDLEQGLSLSRRFEEVQRIGLFFENLFRFLADEEAGDSETRRMLRLYFDFAEPLQGDVRPGTGLKFSGLSAAGMERLQSTTLARRSVAEAALREAAQDPEAIFELGPQGYPVGLKKAARSRLVDSLPFFSYSEGLKKFREEVLFLSAKKAQSSSELQGLLQKEKAQLRGKGYQFDERELNELLSQLHHPNAAVTPEEIENWFRRHFSRLPRQVLEQRRDRLWQNYTAVEERIQNISQLLRAYTLYHLDVDYVVKTPDESELRRHGGRPGQKAVMIVDQFTGRLMPGRRFSDGLHEALEAKEGVQVQAETQTLATITLQNFFRLYKKLAGMTGTAETEAQEFYSTYKLEVVVIPTHKPCIRIDYDDVIFRTKREKYNAIIEEALAMHEQGRPVLIGTISVEVSQHLSNLFTMRGIPMANWLQKGDVTRELESGRFHTVLNAKYHKSEAEIIAKAGLPGAITIATNMAGRGTDIKLAPGVAEKGGLHIIGSEKHEARRIDRQLRGRAGRQGDPGSSRFFLSLEDDLMRLFGSDRITSIMSSLGSMEEGERIEHPLITRSIERAQKKVEERNFEIRKTLLEYDDVLNEQRKIIYRRRQNLLGFAQPEDLVDSKLKKHIVDEKDRSTWKLSDLFEDLRTYFDQTPPFEVDELERLSYEEMRAQILDWTTEQIERRTRYQQLQERHRVFGFVPEEEIAAQLVRMKIRLHNAGVNDPSHWNLDAIRFELERLFGGVPEDLMQLAGLTAEEADKRLTEWAISRYRAACKAGETATDKIMFGALSTDQILDTILLGLMNFHLPMHRSSVSWRTEEFLRDLERIFDAAPQIGANELRSIRPEKIFSRVREWIDTLPPGQKDRKRLLHRFFGFFTSAYFADAVIGRFIFQNDGDLSQVTASEKAKLAELFGGDLGPFDSEDAENLTNVRRRARRRYFELLEAHRSAYEEV